MWILIEHDFGLYSSICATVLHKSQTCFTKGIKPLFIWKMLHKSLSAYTSLPKIHLKMTRKDKTTILFDMNRKVSIFPIIAIMVRFYNPVFQALETSSWHIFIQCSCWQSAGWINEALCINLSIFKTWLQWFLIKAITKYFTTILLEMWQSHA